MRIPLFLTHRENCRCASVGFLHKTQAAAAAAPCRFCWDNWTVPIRAALPHVVHLPIIQLLGNSAPSHFKSSQLFARLYTEWAVKYSFDGFLLDAEVRLSAVVRIAGFYCTLSLGHAGVKMLTLAATS